MVCLLQGLKLQIYRLRRPELLSWVPLIPLQKLPVRFSPGGLEKIPHILGIFFLDILLPLSYIQPIAKQVLIIYHYHLSFHFEVRVEIRQNGHWQTVSRLPFVVRKLSGK